MRNILNLWIGILLTAGFLAGCNSMLHYSTKDIIERNELTQADSVWLSFSDSILTKNISFLISNSFDTIQCADCVPDSNNISEYFPAEFIYMNYLNSLCHPNLLKNHEYIAYQEDNIIRISYNIKSKYAPDGWEGLIYTFRKKDNKFLFYGYFRMP